jgi:hypothetical protein
MTTNAEAAPAKGCGKQIHIAGTNGGTMACGSLLRHLNGELTPQYCPACKSATEAQPPQPQPKLKTSAALRAQDFNAGQHG